MIPQYTLCVVCLWVTHIENKMYLYSMKTALRVVMFHFIIIHWYFFIQMLPPVWHLSGGTELELTCVCCVVSGWEHRSAAAQFCTQTFTKLELPRLWVTSSVLYDKTFSMLLNNLTAGVFFCFQLHPLTAFIA